MARPSGEQVTFDQAIKEAAERGKKVHMEDDRVNRIICGARPYGIWTISISYNEFVTNWNAIDKNHDDKFCKTCFNHCFSRMIRARA
jgi:hypothetical protein